MKTRNLFVVALLAITPLTTAFAQSTGPGMKADSTKSRRR